MDLVEALFGIFEAIFEWRRDPDRAEAREEKKRNARFSHQVGGRADEDQEAPQAMSVGTSSRHNRGE